MGYIPPIRRLLDEAGLAPHCCPRPIPAGRNCAIAQPSPPPLSRSCPAARRLRGRHPQIGVCGRLESGNLTEVRALLDRHHLDLVSLWAGPSPLDVRCRRPGARAVVVVARAQPCRYRRRCAVCCCRGWPRLCCARSLFPAPCQHLLPARGLDIAPLTLMGGIQRRHHGITSVGLVFTAPCPGTAVSAELARRRLVELPVPGTPVAKKPRLYLLAHPCDLPPAAARLVAQCGGRRLPLTGLTRPPRTVHFYP